MNPARRIAPALLLLLLSHLALFPAALAANEQVEEDEEFFEKWLRGDDLDDLADVGLIEAPPLWEVEGKLSGGAGYRDNVMMSAFQPEDGAFLLGSFDLTLFRLGDRFQFSLILTADHLEFLFDEDLPNDTFASAFSHLKFLIREDLSAGLSLRTFYLDQVVDVSSLEQPTEPAMDVRSYGIGLAPSIRKEWAKRFFAEGSFSALRHEVSAPLDDYWEYGPKVAAGWTPSNREFALSLEYLTRDYDQAMARSAEGTSLEGTSLEFRIVRPEISYRHTWGEGKWQSQSRAGFEFNRDNETGYFAYDRLRLFQRLTYRAHGWKIEGALGYSLADYKVQRTDPAGERRRRHGWAGDLTARRDLTGQLKIFARYERDEVRSNDRDTQYTVNTWATGLEWRF